MKVRALQNDTVDQLCWRHYGKTAGVTEKVLEANPGLSNQIFLNAGQEIEMPVITSEVERVTDKNGHKQRTTIWKHAQARQWPQMCNRLTDFVNAGGGRAGSGIHLSRDPSAATHQ